MAIYDSDNGSAAAGAVGAGGATQVEVVVSDDFTKDDAVFMDYKAGTINNFNRLVASNALAAGPATASYTTDQASPVAAWGNRITYDDGSFAIIAASRDVGNVYKLTATRYSVKGIITAKNTIEVASANSIANINAVLLSNGNIGITYLYNAAAGKWAILGPAMQQLTTGGFTGATVYYVQETNDGGFVAIHVNGIGKVSAAGVLTNTDFNIGEVAIQTGENDDQTNQYNARCPTLNNRKLIPISGGGYGVIFSNSTSVNYVQLNADGTPRGAVVVLAAYGSQGVSFTNAARSPNGNICWGISLTSNVGHYGVVADDGTVIKGQTALAAVLGGGGQYLKIVTDELGDFVILGSESGTQWNILYVSAAGVAKATYPKVLAATTAGINRARSLKLSTGVVLLHPPTTYDLQSIFVANNGVVQAPKRVWNFISGNSSMEIAALVYNDKIYGAATTGAGGNCEMVLFTIDNTGATEAAAVYPGVTLPVGVPLAIMMDPSNTLIHVAGTGVIASYGLDKQLVQTYLNSSIVSGMKFKSQQYAIHMHDPSGQVGGAPNLAALNVKVKSTVLLGVAAASAAKGTALLVNTEGIFTTTFKASQNFDHSANNPPGNAGFISNGIINLKGF
jgi:hypothetical protein